MTEHDEQQPLTRRERRLREMSETGALDIEATPVEQAEPVQPVAAPAEPAVSAAPAAPSVDGEADVEISPVNPDGTPRSRREMRQLREEALAALAQSAPAVEPVEPVAEVASEPVVAPEPVAPEPFAAPEPFVAPAAAPEPVITPEPVAFVPEPIVAPEPFAAPEPFIAPEPVTTEAPTTAIPQPVAEPAPVVGSGPEMDFDSLISPPTEAFTVEDLQDAQSATRSGELEDAPSAATAPPVWEALSEAPQVAAEEETKPKRRFWKRGKDSEDTEAPAAEATPEPLEAVAPAPVVGVEPVAPLIPEPAQYAPVMPDPVAPEPEIPAPVAFEPVAVEPVTVEPIVSEPVMAEPVEVEPVIDPVAPESVVAEPEPTEAPRSTAAYSFPDIQPPEEWRSVFDDPNSRVTPVPGKKSEEPGDFDDLISRAVAQEGAAGSSNTSALILPAMPDDTGGLKGPLGGTGELYLTGSIELPKSLGETGGHSALHDSIEMDPITGSELPESQITADQGPSPVAARYAVSARVPSGAPVVAKPTKERSKLPLVLALTGGGLLVVVVGFGVWGATNGMFG